MSYMNVEDAVPPEEPTGSFSAFSLVAENASFAYFQHGELSLRRVANKA